MPLATVNGYSLHYVMTKAKQTKPEPPLIILVNGLADDLRTWDPQVPALAEAGFNVLRYDNRGIGLSSKPAGPYTSKLLASDLHGLVQQLSISKFHLVGISMGGMIAQTYALEYPNGSHAADGCEMLSVSLCCTYAEPTRFCSRMFGLWHDMAIQMSVADVMRDVILWCFTVKYVREKEKELEEIDEAMANIMMSKEAYLSQLNVIQQFDSTPDLLDLKQSGKNLGGLPDGKILVLAGEEDILIPTQLSKELHDSLNNARWKTVKGGHCCALEFADDFNQTMIDFLKNT